MPGIDASEKRPLPQLARAGSGHYRATTEDGQPVNSCYPLGIRFQLKK